jgi:hypothetical protein
MSYFTITIALIIALTLLTILNSFKRKDFLDYMSRVYTANDTGVCVAGKFDEKKIVSEMQGYKRTNIFGAPNMTMSATSSSYSSNLSGNHSATSNFSNMEVDCTSFNQMDVSLGEVASKEQVETDKRRHVRLKMMKSRKWKEEPSDMDLT